VPAQDNGLKTVDATGTLEEVTGYQVKMKDGKGKELSVFIDQTSTAKYSGTADSKVLEPGMMVRFTGRFDTKGVLQGEIKELEIFQPRIGGRMMPNEMEKQTPGVYPVEGKQDANKNTVGNKNTTDNKTPAPTNGAKGSTATNNAKEKSKTAAKQRGNATKPNDAKSSVQTPQDYFVVGQLSGVQGKKLQVNTGNQSLTIQLASSLKINVSMNDISLGVKGDQIRVIGLSQASQPDAVQAKIVTVTGAKPIAPKELDSTAKSTGKTSDKKDGKADSKTGPKPPVKK
jgi:hypothetical protein